MVKELAQSNCEYEVAEQGMVEAGEEKRARVLVSDGKQETPDHAERHSQLVPKNNVDKAKGEGAGQKQQPAGAKKGLVAMNEKRAINQFLRINREQRIEDHDGSPQDGCALDERKEQLWSKQANSETQQCKKDSVSEEKGNDLRTEGGPIREPGGIE